MHLADLVGLVAQMKKGEGLAAHRHAPGLHSPDQQMNTGSV
jgi:hypothetical protein